MTIKEQLILEIEQTSDALLEEFLDLIRLTKARRHIQPCVTLPQSSPSNWVDPLSGCIGATHHGNLAAAIDATFYE